MLKRGDVVQYQYPVKGKNNFGVVDSIDGEYVNLWVNVSDMEWPILIERYQCEIQPHLTK